MKDALILLDQLLKELRQEFYQKLNDGLDEKAINDLEKEFNLELPEDLKSLYRWKNGQTDKCYESFINNSMFISLRESLEINTELNPMIGTDFEEENWWNKGWLPIFHNGGGDYICYDLQGVFTNQKGQIIEFWHADNNRNVIAPNLESFVSAINNYYLNVSPKEFDSFFTLQDLQNYPLTFEV